jgi:hypothetical protein
MSESTEEKTIPKGCCDANRKVVTKSLLDLAKGAVVKEKTEEFALDENGSVFLKSRKITQKHLAPDLQAIKTLMEFKENDGLDDLSDEELEREKQRILKKIEEEQKIENKN